jgi:hypothetical protein
METHATRARCKMFLLLGSSLWGCVGQAPPPPVAEGTGPSETSGTSTGGLGASTFDDGASGPISVSSLDGADSTTTGGGDDSFVFPTDPYDAYTQIDRHGAVEAGTAGILASQGLGFNPGSDIALRDDYNASNPAEDAAGMWLGEIAASLTFFHDAFDDDLMALGLVPATLDQSVAQAGPVIVPDTIKYDPSLPTAYPNGRALTDPVVDITLAAVLLDLNAHPVSLFADLPLNPPENDVPFLDELPYRRAPVPGASTRALADAPQHRGPRPPLPSALFLRSSIASRKKSKSGVVRNVLCHHY